MNNRLYVAQEDEVLRALERGTSQGLRNALREERESFDQLSRNLFLLKEWFTPYEVGLYLEWDLDNMKHESILTAVRRLHDNGLPYTTIGRVRMTRKADLEAWIGRQGNGPDERSA